MSPKKRNHQVGKAASSAWGWTRQAAARVKPVATSAGAAARRGVHRTRAKVAPQVERTGQVLEESVAPKVSAALSSAARRLEPAKPPLSRWRKLAGVSALTAAASAVAAFVRKRSKPDGTMSADEADADEVEPSAERRDGQAKTSTDAAADGNRQVHTS
jgi:hypothetical protein